VSESKFIERRKEYRLPFPHKVIFTDESTTRAAYAVNLSRGGLFIATLEPFPIDTILNCIFMISNHPTSLCLKAKVVHVVFDRQRAEVDCGMGCFFQDLTEAQKAILNLHILNEKATYLDLRRIIANPNRGVGDFQTLLAKIPYLQALDPLALKYKVNRVCTLFEGPPRSNFGDGDDEITQNTQL